MISTWLTCGRRWNTYSEDLPWDVGRNTAQGEELVFGWEVIVLGDVVVLERGLALGVEEGGSANRVLLRVLALGVARGVNESGVQADSLLRGVSVDSTAARQWQWTYDFASVSNSHGEVTCASEVEWTGVPYQESSAGESYGARQAQWGARAGVVRVKVQLI